MKLLIDSQLVLADQEAFDSLLDYTRSQPTGLSVGKRWKRRINWHQPEAKPLWQMGEVFEDPEPGYCLIKYKPLEVV